MLVSAIHCPAGDCKAICREGDSNHKFNIASNLLDRNFIADQPNKKWAGDITYIWTREGWLYLAVILDLHSRRVIALSWFAKANHCQVIVGRSAIE